MVLNFYTITSFINFVFSIVFGVFVFLKNRKDQKNISFFVFALSVALWNLSYFAWQQVTEDPEQAIFLLRILATTIIIIPPCLLYFTLALTETLKEKKKVLVFTYLVFLAFLIADLTPHFIDRVEPILEFKFWPIANWLSSLYMFSFFVCISYAFYILIKKYRVSTGVMRLQLGYVIVGFIISFAGGTVNFLPWFKVPIPPVTHPLVSIYVALIAYAMVKYRLMDIKIVIRNILFYFGVALFAYAFFYAVAFTYQFIFGGVFTAGAYLLGIVIAPVFAVLMYIGSNFFSNAINKYIFYSFYKYKEATKQAYYDLSHYASIDKIADIVINTIGNTLQPDGVAFLLVRDSNLERGKSFELIKSLGLSRDIENSLSCDLLSEYFRKRPKILIKEELGQLIYEIKDDESKNMLVSIKDQIYKSKISVLMPLMGEDGFIGVVAVGITEKNYYNQDDFYLLETLSEQAQVALSNALLYKKVEEKSRSLEAALNAKIDFIRIANHQLNTPLSIMRNAYFMVKDGTLTLKEGLKYWGNGVSRMSQITEDIWIMLQMDSELKMNIEETDIGKLVNDIFNYEKEMLSTQEKKLDFKIKKPSFKIPIVLCDVKQIKHAIQNLLDNAIFYTKEGGITISYELIEYNKYLKINIKDTGIGFSEEEKEKMSQKFYRARKAVLSHPDGSGLGLYISRKIIEGNKGKLTFESEGENKGSTFSFTLPTSSSNSY